MDALLTQHNGQEKTVAYFKKCRGKLLHNEKLTSCHWSVCRDVVIGLHARKSVGRMVAVSVQTHQGINSQVVAKLQEFHFPQRAKVLQ